MKKSKVKIKFNWPKESPKAKQAIETLINEGYIFNSFVTISVDGMKKAFRLDGPSKATPVSTSTKS